MNDDDDERFDICINCYGNDFALHHLEWERVCRHCGFVSPIELSLYNEDDEKKCYSRESYFKNIVLHKIVKKGAPLTNFEMEQMATAYGRSVSLFQQTKDVMGRSSFPSACFVAWKLGLNMGKDLKEWIKLPKLKATLVKLEKDWELINPINY